MSKQTNHKQAYKRRLAQLILLAALALTTLAPFTVSANSTQPSASTPTPTPTPEPIKPPSEFMVSWNT